MLLVLKKVGGQVEHLEEKDSLLFIVTPWFSSMDHVKEFEIKLEDFAIHDSLIDVLHVLKTQEIVTEEVKELLGTVKKQKNDLQRLSLIAEETVNGVIITDTQGRIELQIFNLSRYCIASRKFHRGQDDTYNKETMLHIHKHIMTHPTQNTFFITEFIYDRINIFQQYCED